jgi:hypothetical protein
MDPRSRFVGVWERKRMAVDNVTLSLEETYVGK